MQFIKNIKNFLFKHTYLMVIYYMNVRSHFLSI